MFVNCPASLPLLCPPFEGVSVTWYCASTVCGVPDAISREQVRAGWSHVLANVLLPLCY